MDHRISRYGDGMMIMHRTSSYYMKGQQIQIRQIIHLVHLMIVVPLMAKQLSMVIVQIFISQLSKWIVVLELFLEPVMMEHLSEIQIMRQQVVLISIHVRR